MNPANPALERAVVRRAKGKARVRRRTVKRPKLATKRKARERAVGRRARVRVDFWRILC